MRKMFLILLNYGVVLAYLRKDFLRYENFTVCFLLMQNALIRQRNAAKYANNI